MDFIDLQSCESDARKSSWEFWYFMRKRSRSEFSNSAPFHHGCHPIHVLSYNSRTPDWKTEKGYSPNESSVRNIFS